MCKGNCALIVKINPPQGWSRGKDKSEKGCTVFGTEGLPARAFLPLRFCLTFRFRHGILGIRYSFSTISTICFRWYSQVHDRERGQCEGEVSTEGSLSVPSDNSIPDKRAG